MNIMICGSMTFAHDMTDLQKKLEKLGHKVFPPIGMEPHLADPTFPDNLEDDLKFCIENDVMRRNFKQLAEQDAVLIFNKKKNGVEGYMGVSTLMEAGIAHFLNKKIFILYKIPHFNEHRWAHEVSIMQPIFLEGDLTRIPTKYKILNTEY